MSFIFVSVPARLRQCLFSLTALVCVVTPAASAQVYQSTTGSSFSNFIPLGPDGTPGRPVPGDHMGNQITLAGTNRLVDEVRVSFGLNTNFGQNPNPATDNYTVDFYRNDGAGGAPGTLFSTSTVTGTNPGASVLTLSFPFETLVPNTFTVVVSSTHPTNTAGTLAGVVGPYSAGGNPGIGSAVNTIWYNTNPAATSWVSNSTWAIADGAAFNYFTMTVNASPVVAYDNGATNLISSPTTSRVYVANNTTATFNAGGNVNVSLFSATATAVTVADTSHLNNVAADFTASASSSGSAPSVATGLRSLDQSIVTVSGGLNQGSISTGGFVTNRAAGMAARGSSRVLISGGSFVGFISSGGFSDNSALGLSATDSSNVQVVGGTFTGTVSAGGGGTTNASGISAAGNANVAIFGGNLTGDTDLLARDNAKVTLYGSGFNRPFGLVGDLSGTITGTLESGQFIDFSFLQDHAQQIRLSPVLAPQWFVNADGNWSDAVNWHGAVPSAAGAVANFGAAITLPRSVTLDVPRTVGQIKFDNANSYTLAGTSTLTIATAGGSGSINVLNGSHTIAAPVALAVNTDVALARSADTLSISGGVSGAAGVSLNKTGPGTLALKGIRNGGLSISGGNVQMLPDGTSAGIGSVSVLSIAGGTTPTAKLDLTNNAFIVDYAPGPQTEPLDTIRAQIIAGYNGGGGANAWTGNGITRSDGDATHRGIGYAEADSLGSIPPIFGAMPTSAVLIRATRYGDADLDGAVNLLDFNRLAANFGLANKRWIEGDFNYDGTVDLLDFNLLAGNFGLSVIGPNVSPQDWSNLAAAVPEPVVGIGLLVSFALSRRRRG